MVFVPLILFGLSRAGAWVLGRTRHNEDAYFVLMLGIMAVAGVLAKAIDLPDIVGAFLAGLAVNAAVAGHPAKVKLQFFGQALFIPAFFIVPGFLWRRPRCAKRVRPLRRVPALSLLPGQRPGP